PGGEKGDAVAVEAVMPVSAREVAGGEVAPAAAARRAGRACPLHVAMPQHMAGIEGVDIDADRVQAMREKVAGMVGRAQRLGEVRARKADLGKDPPALVRIERVDFA